MAYFSEEITSSFKRKNWNRLGELVQEDYGYILSLSRTLPQDDVECVRLANIIAELIKHSRNVDLRNSLFYDFGNFVSVQLDPSEFIEQLVTETGTCMVCMDATEVNELVVFHRECGRVLGHMECLKMWWSNPGVKRCLSC